MTAERPCDEFQEHVDALASGDAEPRLARRLETHAAACPDCRALLALVRRLAAATDERLEAAVPDHLAAGMWSRLRPSLAQRSDTSTWRRWIPQRAAPAWAAAAVLLLVCGGLLAGEVIRLRGRVDELAAMTRRERTSLAVSSWLDLSAAGLTRSWGELTVAEASVRLAQLPPATSLLGPEAARTWLARVRQHDRRVGSMWLRGVRIDDGLQAGEALRLIDALQPPPETPLKHLLPTSAARAAARA